MPRTVDFGTLNISDVIVHEVPKRGEGQPPLKLSNHPSPLEDQELGVLIRSRIVQSVGKGKIQISFNPEFSGSAPEHICSILSGDTQDFVQASRELASSLHQVQPRHASAGILLIVKTNNRGHSGVAIMKMEPQEGVRLVWNGEHCDLRRMVDLMLTEHTKLYKVGYFESHDEADGTPIRFIADIQARSRRVSSYFLENFLCCTYAESPKEVTRNFHSASVDFINHEVHNAERRAQYGLALVSELKSNVDTFSPQAFAAQHLTGDDRQAFEGFIEERGIDPTATYAKDVDLITGSLKVTSLVFESGISVIGKPEAFEAHVTTEEHSEGQLEVTIRDTLKEVKA